MTEEEVWFRAYVRALTRRNLRDSWIDETRHLAIKAANAAVEDWKAFKEKAGQR